MKDTKDNINQRILDEIRLKKIEYYNKKFSQLDVVVKVEEPPVVKIVEVDKKDQLPKCLEIVLNGENICTIDLNDVTKVLKKTFDDFKTLTIEGFNFEFEDNRCYLNVKTKSNPLYNVGVRKFLNVLTELQSYMDKNNKFIDVEVKIIYSASY